MANTIELDDLSQLGGVMLGIEQDLKNAEYRPALEEAVEKLEVAHREAYANETSQAGDKWPALSPRTVKAKGHDIILWDSGDMERSLGEHTGDSIRDIIDEKGNAGLAFGTSVEYAGYHMTGTKHIPQRQHVGVDEETLDSIVGDVADRTVEVIKEGKTSGHGATGGRTVAKVRA